MEMTYQYQDNLLLYDILDRNYFYYFKKANNQSKYFNLTFFYNDNYTNFQYIPNLAKLSDSNNFNTIYNNWLLFLKWYKYNNFYTDLIINDDILLQNYDYLSQILNAIFDNNVFYRNIIIKYNVDQQNNFYNFIDFINNYEHTNKIKIIFNIHLSKIDQIESSILQQMNNINILIEPCENGDVLINNQILINTLNLNINKYIEIDSDLWTENCINEYIKYLTFLISNLSNINEIFNTNLPIKLIDQHIIDNTNCKTNCEFQNSLSILMADLSINLCHSFQYDDQVIGYFVKDDENILTVEAKILPLAMLTTHLKRSSTPHCETCPYINLCSGFCFANSYKKCFNPAIPIKESCILKKSKYSFIFNILIKNTNFKDIIDDLKCSDIYKEYLLSICNNLIKE